MTQLCTPFILATVHANSTQRHESLLQLYPNPQEPRSPTILQRLTRACTNLPHQPHRRERAGCHHRRYGAFPRHLSGGGSLRVCGEKGGLVSGEEPGGEGYVWVWVCGHVGKVILEAGRFMLAWGSCGVGIFHFRSAMG